jgi:hypothetical protein
MLWNTYMPILIGGLFGKRGGDRVCIFILHILIGEKSAYIIFYMCAQQHDGHSYVTRSPIYISIENFKVLLPHLEGDGTYTN